MTAYLVRAVANSEHDSVLRLHNQSFGAQWSQAWWDWRYRSAPREGAVLLGAFGPDGQCVGLYAGVRLLMRLRGETCWVLNQSDVCLDPSLRAGIASGRLIKKMTQEFFRRYCHGSTRLAYGFPIPPLRRIVARFAGGQVQCDVVMLVHDLHPQPQQEPIDGSGVRVCTVPIFGDDVDGLWEQTSASWGAAIVRDSTYLNWRFAQHPVDYCLLEARDGGSGKLRGIAVVREGGLDPAVSSLSEWMVPASDAQAEAALVRAVVEFGRRRGSCALIAWFSGADDHFRRFQERYGFRARASSYQELIYRSTTMVDREWLHSHWYQTMGDIDFF